MTTIPSTEVDPAAEPESLPATAPTDEGRRGIARVIAELNGVTQLLRCASTGRLVRQGVSMTHVHVLWLLDEHGELPMSQVAELVGVSDSNASGLIDRMEERGLVERVRVSDDRRVVRVRIVAGGRAALDEIQIIKDDLAIAVLERLSDRQLERLRASLRDFRAAVRAEAAASPGQFGSHHHHEQRMETSES